jgi:hypothetical protein
MGCCFSAEGSDAVAEKVRCAIYTRKSTEEGLDQEFNSLRAQRESAEAYIKSQHHLGWTMVAQHYDDGGVNCHQVLAEQFHANQNSPLGCAQVLDDAMPDSHFHARMRALTHPFESNSHQSLNAGERR